MEELPQQQEEEEDAAGNRRAVPAAWEPGQLNVIQRLWEELELEPHIIMMDTAVDVKTGYGAHGASFRSSVARGPDPMALRSGGHAEAPSCREARDSPSRVCLQAAPLQQGRAQSQEPAEGQEGQGAEEGETDAAMLSKGYVRASRGSRLASLPCREACKQRQNGRAAGAFQATVAGAGATHG